MAIAGRIITETETRRQEIRMHVLMLICGRRQKHQRSIRGHHKRSVSHSQDRIIPKLHRDFAHLKNA